jgi:hypothetical protein
MKTIYIETKIGEQFKIEIGDEHIDQIFDQLNLGPAKYIDAKDFDPTDLMAINIVDINTEEKIGVLYCKNII